MRGYGVAAAALTAVALSVGLAGCVPQEKAPSSSAPSTSSTPTPVASDAPPPVLVPNGTSTENKPFFDYVNQQVVASAPEGHPDGPAFINALRSGGFDGSSMELTPDITTVGVKADSIQFSVHTADGCLIGQWGTVGGYVSMAAAVTSTGKCLIGETRAIDF